MPWDCQARPLSGNPVKAVIGKEDNGSCTPIQSYNAFIPKKAVVAMPDQEKDRLVAAHYQAALIYSRLLISMSRVRVASPDYEQLRGAANDARTRCQEARLAVESYSARHDSLICKSMARAATAR